MRHFVYCNDFKLIVFVCICLSFNCIFLFLPLLFSVSWTESSSVDPDMKVKHDLFLYWWGVRVYMQVCLYSMLCISVVKFVTWKWLCLEDFLHLHHHVHHGYRWRITGYYIVVYGHTPVHPSACNLCSSVIQRSGLFVLFIFHCCVCCMNFSWAQWWQRTQKTLFSWHVGEVLM